MLKMVLVDKMKKRLLIKAWLLLVIFITNCSSSGGEEEVKKGEGVSVKLKVDKYIEEINEGLLSRSKMLKEGVKIESKGDTGWVLNIGGDEVSVLEFEEKYKKYQAKTNKSEDKLSFVLVFLEKYDMLPKAEEYFKGRNGKEEIEFVKKQLRVQTYMAKKLGLWEAASKGKTIKERELLEFYNVLKKQKGYKKLRYENDKEKVKELYRINKINKSYVELEREVKGRYSIEINDEWEGGVVNRYKSGKLDIKQAVRLGQYKRYWLYRINVKGGGKLELYVRDLEKKLRLSKKFFGIGAKGGFNILRKSSRKDKESLLNSFLMEELLYLEIDKVFIESNKGVLSELWDKMVLNYYISKKLGIKALDYVKYMDEYIDREKIGVNRRYFKG